MKSVLPILFLALASALSPLSAQGPWGGPSGCEGPRQHGFRSGGKHLGPFACLQLSEAQKKDMKALRDKHEAAMESKRNALQEAQKDLRQAMHDKGASESSLKALHQKASDARFAMMTERRSLMAELESLLTPEQKAELEKRRADLDARPHGPRVGGRGRMQ